MAVALCTEVGIRALYDEVDVLFRTWADSDLGENALSMLELVNFVV